MVSLRETTDTAIWVERLGLEADGNVTRVAAGMTRKDLAERVGVSQATLSRFEHGDHSPSVADLNLNTIAAELHVSTAFLADTDGARAPLTVGAHMRRRASAPPPQWKKAEAELNLLRAQVTALVGSLDLQPSSYLPAVDPEATGPGEAAGTDDTEFARRCLVDADNPMSVPNLRRERGIRLVSSRWARHPCRSRACTLSVHSSEPRRSSQPPCGRGERGVVVCGVRIPSGRCAWRSGPWRRPPCCRSAPAGPFPWKMPAVGPTVGVSAPGDPGGGPSRTTTDRKAREKDDRHH